MAAPSTWEDSNNNNKRKKRNERKDHLNTNQIFKIMKKQFKLMALASATMLFAACSQENLLSPQEQLAQNPENNVIQFGTYMGKAGTRTVATGTNGSIKDNDALQAKGFGLFAYYTGTNTYQEKNYPDATPTPTLAPNFMYNEHVSYTSSWGYSPVKYWPNESTSGANIDGSNAATAHENGGKLSFFAYAPYTEKGTQTEGITDFSSNTTSGDPIVTYVVPAALGDFVDLLWGTTGTNGVTVLGADQNGVSSNGSGNFYEKAILDGYTVNADLTKQKTNGKVDFAFKHALAKLGGALGAGLTIQADVDKDGEISGNEVASDTRVTVESITITVKAQNDANKYVTAAKTGTFNLATGKWTPTVQDDEVAMYTYTVSGDALNNAIKDPGLTSWDTGLESITGVIKDPVSVYSSGSDAAPIILFPGTKPTLNVSIAYYVNTHDTKLNNNMSRVKQVINKTITFSNMVELNKFYKLAIHLGLTSVKFTASVSNWDDPTSSPDRSTDVHLPINVK